MCSKAHFVFSCEKFRALAIDSRILKATEYKVCLNFLRSDHTDAKCRLSHCKYCKGKYNISLHKNAEPSFTPETVALSAYNSIPNSSRYVLLSTALVKAYDGNANPHSARVLFGQWKPDEFHNARHVS